MKILNRKKMNCEFMNRNIKLCILCKFPSPKIKLILMKIVYIKEVKIWNSNLFQYCQADISG